MAVTIENELQDNLSNFAKCGTKMPRANIHILRPLTNYRFAQMLHHKRSIQNSFD